MYYQNGEFTFVAFMVVIFRAIIPIDIFEEFAKYAIKETDHTYVLFSI